MATAAVAPVVGVPCRRIVWDGSRLIVNEAAGLVNFQATENLSRALREWANSLKPRILQAPAANDKAAQEQASVIEEYAQIANDISEKLGNLNTESSIGVPEDFYLLLGEFNEYLSDAGDELRALQRQPVVVKYACQDEVKDQLERKKQETLNRIIMFCYKNGLIANSAIVQTQTQLQQFIDLVGQHMELSNRDVAQVKDQRLDYNGEAVKLLVAREVNAVLQARHTDEWYPSSGMGTQIGHRLL
ncbi:hypothetical protein RhiJN_20078 [Ceratobasidium sp. AG-Ba]|nr:hypothetical protein RhiJN_20078 [Ceratobasidium sp. AG-Ba]